MNRPPVALLRVRDRHLQRLTFTGGAFSHLTPGGRSQSPEGGPALNHPLPHAEKTFPFLKRIKISKSNGASADQSAVQLWHEPDHARPATTSAGGRLAMKVGLPGALTPGTCAHSRKAAAPSGVPSRPGGRHRHRLDLHRVSDRRLSACQEALQSSLNVSQLLICQRLVRETTCCICCDRSEVSPSSRTVLQQ
jgi:hypothetical protein